MITEQFTSDPSDRERSPTIIWKPGLTGCEGRTLKFRGTDRACIKTEGLVFHGTAQAIRLMNSLLHGKNENILKIHQEFVDNFPTDLFTRNLFKIVFSRFSADFQIICQLSENSQRNIISHKFCQSIFLSSVRLRIFPRIFRRFSQRRFSILFNS